MVEGASLLVDGQAIECEAVRERSGEREDPYSGFGGLVVRLTAGASAVGTLAQLCTDGPAVVQWSITLSTANISADSAAIPGQAQAEDPTGS